MKVIPFGTSLVIIPGDLETTLSYAADAWIQTAKKAIADHGFFTVALSGGSTPKAIYKLLSERKDALDFSKVYLFFSDERMVALDHKDSNYKSAMDSGFGSLPIPKEQIFPFQNADIYEKQILEHVPKGEFDLVMLGVGDDGHTASLFPKTQGLTVKGRNCTQNGDRLTMTFECINKAHEIVFYVCSLNKANIVKKIFLTDEDFPAKHVGTMTNPALYFIDESAARDLL